MPLRACVIWFGLVGVSRKEYLVRSPERGIEGLGPVEIADDHLDAGVREALRRRGLADQSANARALRDEAGDQPAADVPRYACDHNRSCYDRGSFLLEARALLRGHSFLLGGQLILLKM